MPASPENIRASDACIERKLEDIDSYERHLVMTGRMSRTRHASLEKARAIRAGHSVLLYLAGPLTGVEDSVKQRYADVSNMIGELDGMFGYAPHLHGTDPVKHPAVTPAEVRDIDYLFAAITPDAHINFLYPVAHGNAIEAGWAEERGIPSLYIVPASVTLSRLVKGMNNVIDTIVYKDFEQDALPRINEFIGGI
jgi:hypothetical protein